MKRILMTAAAFALAAGAAYAAESMAGIYGNTVDAKSATGETKVWYKADHTYAASDSKGAKMAGTWAIKDGQLCTMQNDPKPAAGHEKDCGPDFSSKKAGDTWEATGADGTKWTVTVVKGM